MVLSADQKQSIHDMLWNALKDYATVQDINYAASRLCENPTQETLDEMRDMFIDNACMNTSGVAIADTQVKNIVKNEILSIFVSDIAEIIKDVYPIGAKNFKMYYDNSIVTSFETDTHHTYINPDTGSLLTVNEIDNIVKDVNHKYYKYVSLLHPCQGGSNENDNSSLYRQMKIEFDDGYSESGNEVTNVYSFYGGNVIANKTTNSTSNPPKYYIPLVQSGSVGKKAYFANGFNTVLFVITKDTAVNLKTVATYYVYGCGTSVAGTAITGQKSGIRLPSICIGSEFNKMYNWHILCADNKNYYASNNSITAQSIYPSWLKTSVTIDKLFTKPIRGCFITGFELDIPVPWAYQSELEEWSDGTQYNYQAAIVGIDNDNNFIFFDTPYQSPGHRKPGDIIGNTHEQLFTFLEELQGTMNTTHIVKTISLPDSYEGKIRGFSFFWTVKCSMNNADSHIKDDMFTIFSTHLYTLNPIFKYDAELETEDDTLNRGKEGL